jgi:hypothetical protein
MAELTEFQVDLIDAYIKENGVAQNELQEDLLDHLCTSVEGQIQQGKSFEEAFQHTITLFGPGGLKQVQTETFQLLTEMNATMKKVTFGFGLTSTFLLLAGTIFKLMHWPGANIMFMTGAMILALIYLPLILRHKLKESPSNEALLHISGFVGLAFTTVGSLFKIMHWPGASMLLIVGMGTLAFLYIPIYFYKRYQTSANKPITLSASLVAMTCLILVFALTRVNNSVGYDSGITQIDEQLRNSTKLASNNQALYNLLADNLQAQEIQTIANETVEYLESLKATIVSTVDQIPLEQARNKRLFYVKNATDFRTPTELLFNSSESDPSNINQMVAKLNKFETAMMQVYPDGIRDQIAQTFPIDTDASFDVDGEQWEWGKYSFYKIPIIGVISNLSKLQSEIRQSENQALIYLISRPEALDPPS